MEQEWYFFQCGGVKSFNWWAASKEISYNFMSDYIKARDFNDVNVAIACEQPDEAKNIMQELGKRGVACLLLNKTNDSLDLIIGLLTEGLLNSTVVISDDILPAFAELNSSFTVDLLIQLSNPLPHVYQNRIQLLTQASGGDPKIVVVVITLPEMQPEQLEVKENLAVEEIPVPISVENGDILEDSTENSFLNESPQLNESVNSMPTVLVYNFYGIYAQSEFEQQISMNLDAFTELHPEVKEAMITLKLGTKVAKGVQRFAWPHSALNRSMCVIGNHRIGKTWCYLPWLCHRFMKEMERGRDDDISDYGPSSIIVCSDAKKGEEIAFICIKLTSKVSANMMRVVTLFDRNEVHDIAEQMRNDPCGILITNLKLMLKLCAMHGPDMPIFNPRAIQCVAIDNLISNSYFSPMDTDRLFQWFFHNFRFSEDHSQMLIVDSLWNGGLMNRALLNLQDVLLLFEDALEASIYGEIKLEVITMDSEYPMQEIVKLLKTFNLSQERVVLACSNKKKVYQLAELLLKEHIGSVLVYDATGLKAYNSWSCNHNSRVLIAADQAICKLNGDYIDYLIHCTPAKDWDIFKTRFNLFYGNYPWHPSSKKGTSLVFLRNGASDLDHLWHLCAFMYKHDRKVPDNWLTWLSRHRCDCEATLRVQPLCHQILKYGDCFRASCAYRHRFWRNEIMRPVIYPKNYEIQFYILSVMNPSQLVVKLTKFEIDDYFMGTPLTNLGRCIQFYYEHSINRRQLHSPKPGDVGITKLNDLYQRVKVKAVNRKNIEVKQLDAGTEVIKIKAADLWECELQFLRENYEATEIRIAGLMPYNMERNWSEDVTDLVRKHFRRAQLGKPLKVYTATVEFKFAGVQFVTNVSEGEENDIKSLLLCHMNVRMEKKIITRFQKLCNDTIKRVVKQE